MSASLVDECYRRANDARRSAELASMPSEKTHFLEVEQRWLLAAASAAPKTAPDPKAFAEAKIPNVRTRMPSKFTPETIEQIRNLVVQGRSSVEIAGLLGVTVGTLQVNCSKRGISLRRRPSPPNKPSHTEGSNHNPEKVDSLRFGFEQVDEHLLGALQNEAAPRPVNIEYPERNYANLALTMHWRDRERTVPLRLPGEVIAALALESQLRKMTLGELVGEIVAGALAYGLSSLLDQPGLVPTCFRPPLSRLPNAGGDHLQDPACERVG
jgi:hypothetical protein